MITTGELPQQAINRGNSFARTYSMNLRDEEEVQSPLVLTDFDLIRMDIRDKPSEDGELFLRLDTDTGGILIGGDDNNELTVIMTDADTRRFIPNVTPFQGNIVKKGTSVTTSFNGRYYADIVFVKAGMVKTFLKTTYLIIANITQTP